MLGRSSYLFEELVNIYILIEGGSNRTLTREEIKAAKAAP